MHYSFLMLYYTSFSEREQLGTSETLMMVSAQVVETSVNTNNSPSHDYTTNPDDHSNHNIYIFLLKY